ncbi:MAG: hypothetical protein RBR86_04270 [Pseudobdellovibrionaceae bacterium]|nr:hypothetical protein [Pseudobdellovibrionaceae bacterium]
MSLIENFTKALAVPALVASTAFAGAAYAHGEGWSGRNFDRHEPHPTQQRYDQRDRHDRGDRYDRRGDRRGDYRGDYRGGYRNFHDNRDRPVYIAPRVQPRYNWEYGYYAPPAPVYVQPVPRVYVQPFPRICFNTGDRHFQIGGCF